ncbi:DUF2288 domain-containing protein [uncultured Abyssibacter sp.]|uniref:DUF2288 domain-containing protein n=1 Tax=uncultured Abyssibacter sp. TaxID=2320202 RepID=UPI0032B291B9
MNLEDMRAELATQTAKMPWSDLQRFFATGQAFAVAAGIDLVDVAARIAIDDKAAVEALITEQHFGPVSDAQALEWIEQDASVWTVVVKPWVLVQAIADTD